MRSPILAAVLLAVGCATSQPAVEPTPAAAAEVAPAPAQAEPVTPPVEDPYLWLEEVSGARPLGWVETQNKKALAELDSPAREALRQRLLAIFDSKEKIPYAEAKGKWLYNFWRDEQHARGLWRRVSVDGYQKKDPAWETVIDLDALAAAEKENWVFKGSECLNPKQERCLISLSRGGGDATVTREFDVVKKQFVADGFVLPEAKPSVTWKDENTLFVATDFGPGSLTTSGYPRVVKEWKRGTALEKATFLSEGKESDVDVFAYRDWHQGKAI
ncbi:MAG: prolyl oligopeptidase, partial [Myxococcaceae bacterium]|nr:prolyl oligopeptidase [Myxococcaceae bacterium]